MPADLTASIRLTADGKGFVGEMRIAGKELKRFGAGARKASAAIDATGQAARRAERGLRGWWRRLKSAHGRAVKYAAALVGAGGLIAATKALAAGIVRSGLAMERLNARLAAGGRGVRLAASDVDFLRRKAEELGLEFGAIGDAFAGFAAATRGTPIEKQAREIFSGVLDGAAALKLGAEDTRGVLLAMEQMVSKGVVSAEELRGQMGERLPGAFRLAADAMRVTTEELDDLLRQGKVTAEDLLPKLARELSGLYGADARRAISPG